ncbi:MAG: diaminopropionate ammonia-lyase [Gemmatimonadetes bacterium]|nr:diaminopropionate ammonia-lyase [Gemmatimonadota bacterium]
MTSEPFIFPFRLLANVRADRRSPYGEAERRILSHAAAAVADREIRSWPGYAPTPLQSLRGIARALGIERVWYKDESGRFGLGSFKALGGAYGVLLLLKREVERRTGTSDVRTEDLRAGRYQGMVSDITVTCASSGNHGRSVAWGAQMLGCRCVIYLHAAVSERRAKAIAGLGAEVVMVQGIYDDAVRRADEDARRYHRFVISDTSYPGYLEIPRDVMQGYTVMVREALDQLPAGERPTHVLVQAGVGGLAAAVCAHLWEAWGSERPILVVVEPEEADCCYRSSVKGRPTTVPGQLRTIMTGLAAAEPSLLAWEILERGADFFLTIPDEPSRAAMRLLAGGKHGDPPIAAGESGAAGLAALMTAIPDGKARDELRLGPSARVLVFGTEGATDPEIYERIVGRRTSGLEG